MSVFNSEQAGLPRCLKVVVRNRTTVELQFASNLLNRLRRRRRVALFSSGWCNPVLNGNSWMLFFGFDWISGEQERRTWQMKADFRGRARYFFDLFIVVAETNQGCSVLNF